MHTLSVLELLVVCIMSSKSNNMESENITDPCEDNRNVNPGRQLRRSTKTDSQQSSFEQHKKNVRGEVRNEDEKDACVDSRSKTRTWHANPDQDQVSDEEEARSRRSSYSDDCENTSPSESSISPYSESRTPSPTPQTGRAKRISSSPLYKTGGVVRHSGSCPERFGVQPLTQRRRRAVHSQNKDSSPPKDMDLVTKRMLSARLLKINELRNALAELQQRIDALQKENRILKQLQVRQEKALQRYDNTENEISQLMARHSSETHVLRERLRRSRERERAAERQLREREEQLTRSQAANARLKKLVDQRELGARDELSRKLEEEKGRSQQAEEKIRDLERSMELSSSSYRRQLAAERRRTLGAQEEIRTLQEELERLTNKLKEKERELDVRNIYANRTMKPPLRNDGDGGTKRKVPSRTSTKAAQTKDRRSSLDFPTPPPAVADGNSYTKPAADEYLSLKQEQQQGEQQKTRGHVQEDKPLLWERGVLEEKAQRPGGEEEARRTGLLGEEAARRAGLLGEEAARRAGLLGEEAARRAGLLGEEEARRAGLLGEEEDREQGPVQEEVRRRNQDALANQQAGEEEARRRKEQLLAKMREIDEANRGARDAMFAPELSEGTAGSGSPCAPAQRKYRLSTFNLSEPEESTALDDAAGGRASRRWLGTGGGAGPTGGGAGPTGAVRRPLRPLPSSDDLAFGGYAPSFGNSASRVASGAQPPPPREDRASAAEGAALRGGGAEKGKKDSTPTSSLMQELFGAVEAPAGDYVNSVNTTEALSSRARSRRDGLLAFHSRPSSLSASSRNTLHVAESRPAVCAIASFDDDIEELAL